MKFYQKIQYIREQFELGNSANYPVGNKEMTRIESYVQLERIADALERIADHLDEERRYPSD